MGLREKFRKFSIYLNPEQAYWRRIEHNNWKVDSKLGAFFGMHLKDRLFENHYDKFDAEELPIRIVEGKKTYNYTTICSYALANWELYLETGDKKFTSPLWKALSFLKNNNELTDYGGIVFPIKGMLSAMNQGEALSVIARCYELNREEELKVFAAKIIKAYQMPVSKNGVLGKISQLSNVYWFEELATLPGKHILNGMCYALIGLHDIYTIFPELTEAQELWKKGVQYLKQALPLFNQGDWSWYWLNENPPHYIASMMYHNLHVVQLHHLYSITGEVSFLEFSEKFDEYQKSFIRRLNAGLQLLKAKRRL